MRNFAATFVLGLTLAAAPAAMAETLYKMIDKAGKVTYGEKPPENFDGQVIRIDIDPNANTATLPKPAAGPADPLKAGPETPKGGEVKSRVQIARENLEKARKNLQDAKDNPGPEDLLVMKTGGGGGAARRGGMHGTTPAGGMHGTNAQQPIPPPEKEMQAGTRSVPTDAYLTRLSALEAAVTKAEEELRQAEDGK